MKTETQVRKDEGLPVQSPPSDGRLRRTLAALALVAVGAALGAGGMLLGEDPSPVRTTSGAEEAAPVVGTPTCTTYEMPGLEASVIARSSLVPGSMYTIRCSDGAGDQVLNETFVFGDPREAEQVERGVSILPSP